MECDVCGKAGEVDPVSHLICSKGLRHICRRCARIADKLLDKYRYMAWVRAKRKLLAMKRAREKAGE